MIAVRKDSKININSILGPFFYNIQLHTGHAGFEG
jgi:hypothetical protein